MNEIDLIKRYLERSGAYRIKNIYYYNEGDNVDVATSVLMGVVIGVQPEYVYCFGNLDCHIELSGVITLADKNKFRIKASTALPYLKENGFYETSLCIGGGLNLLGDGTYEGYKRIYGIGFNRLDLEALDIAAATFVLNYNFNGYIFILR